MTISEVVISDLFFTSVQYARFRTRNRRRLSYLRHGHLRDLHAGGRDEDSGVVDGDMGRTAKQS